MDKPTTSTREALILNVTSDLKRNADLIAHKPIEDFVKKLDNNNKVEHYASVLRKYSFLIKSIGEIESIRKNISNSIEVEYHFYAGVFYAVSALDSLACLVNDFYDLVPEKVCGFNNGEFLVKMPRFVKNVIDSNQKDLKELYNYRNSLAHRRVFLVIPGGRSPDDINIFLVPANSKIKLTELKSVKEEFTETTNLLSEFERLVGGIIVRVFVNWPDKKLNKFS